MKWFLSQEQGFGMKTPLHHVHIPITSMWWFLQFPLSFPESGAPRSRTLPRLMSPWCPAWCTGIQSPRFYKTIHSKMIKNAKSSLELVARCGDTLESWWDQIRADVQVRLKSLCEHAGHVVYGNVKREKQIPVIMALNMLKCYSWHSKHHDRNFGFWVYRYTIKATF